MDKYLSIITNFGCHWECPYCIVKNNKILIPKTEINSLDNLENDISRINPDIISISGGGDPLYNFYKNIEYYNKLYFITKKNRIPIELHTSYLIHDFNYYCERIVYHCRSINDLMKISKKNKEIIRVVFVATKNISAEYIDLIYEFVNTSKIINELSFRQMIDKDYMIRFYNHEYLKSRHKDRWYYIEQNDYNTYYVNGEIFNKYSEIGV